MRKMLLFSFLKCDLQLLPYLFYRISVRIKNRNAVLISLSFWRKKSRHKPFIYEIRGRLTKQLLSLLFQGWHILPLSLGWPRNRCLLYWLPVGHICKEYVVFNTKLCCSLLTIQLMDQLYFILFAILSWGTRVMKWLLKIPVRHCREGVTFTASLIIKF